jgi:hypothetical protein
MLTQGAGFDRYSKSLCWIFASTWLALSILTFTGDSEISTTYSLLWLAQ